MIIYVLSIGGYAKHIKGNPTLTSLDGEKRAPLSAIKRLGREAEFGVYEVSIEAPDGKQWTGHFDGTVTPPVAIYEDVNLEEALAQERKGMSCSPMQGILTIGEEKWGEVLTYRETATWAEKVIIDSSTEWQRVSENIEFIGYLIGYSDEQMDDMFRTARHIRV